MRNCFALLFFISCHLDLSSQNTIGIPDIVNYKKQTYNAGTQNWEITQDSNGIVYFANNEGLLSFDGTYWKLFPLPNKTIVRSLEIGPDNRIYVGGQDEIGFFSPNKNGKLTYTSLKSLIPAEHRSITDVWDIVHIGTDIYFQTTFKILRLADNKVEVYIAKSKWSFLGILHNVVVAQDNREGLLKLQDGRWIPLLEDPSLLDNLVVTSIAPFGKDSVLVTTDRNGIFLINENKVSRFDVTGFRSPPAQRFSTLIKIDNESYALGTTEGCYIINRLGKIVQSFSKKTGLQNEVIHTLFIDKNKNIWLGLETGIDFIAFGNAIKHINPPGLNDKAGYAAIIHKNNLFVATTNGVYKIAVPFVKDLSYSKDAFTLVRNSEGQTYGLSVINDNLLMGGNEGLFYIRDNTAFPIIKGNGYWTFQPLEQSRSQSLIVAGNYTGLQLIENKNSSFLPTDAISNFNESARFITIDQNNAIWTSHPYRGVYKIEYNDPKNPVIKLYTTINGLPSSLNNHVYKVKNRIVIATEEGIYEYDPLTDRFKPSDFFKNIFKSISIRYLKEDPDGNIWFINEKNLGVVDFSYEQPKIIYLPELKGKMVSGFEHVYPVNENNIFLGAEEGFYHINYEQYKKNDYTVNVHIRTVLALGKSDSLLFGGYFGEVNVKAVQSEKSVPKIHHQWNSFHIEFSSPLYEQQSNIEYSYFLNGFDKNWSDWQKKTEKDYTNLPAGGYTFQVRARNNLGNESAPAKFMFTVLPPWYQTPWAYVSYFAVFLFTCYLIYKWQQKRFLAQQRKHKEEQKRLQYLHQLELEKSEKEIVKLKNEKLETEIDYKNSELASTAMHLVQKGELLTKIKDELLRLNKDSKDKEPLENLKKIIRILSQEERINEDWSHFAVHFDKVHSDFLLLLKDKFPNLSAHELKLCAYLRMNLSSKEIAQLMNISVRGVEISRYRLRKKLQLPTEVNLFGFLLSLQGSEFAKFKNSQGV